MKIPYGRQFIDEDDISEVVKALKSEFLTTGPKIDEFERKFAEFVGSKYAIAVSNGTAALHVACLAANLRKSDELITSSMTFAASANCALYCNAKPKFVDTTIEGLIDPALIQNQITKNSKILIPVHYGGMPCDLQEIREISQNNNLIVIEDACHALGASYSKNNIGNGKYSDMAVFSFHPVKHITTGEGGMITTNSPDYYEKLKIIRTHGITKSKEQMQSYDGPWYYEMQTLGYNYRLTDVQAALGLSQLRKIDTFISRRREIAEKYDIAFNNNPNIDIIKNDEKRYSSYHLYPILVKEKSKRREVFEKLRQNNIWVQVHYIPVYFHPFYQKLGFQKGLCPNAEEFYAREISIPMYPAMSDSDVDFVINTIQKIFD